MFAADPVVASRAPCSTHMCSISQAATRNSSKAFWILIRSLTASARRSYKCQVPHWEPSIQKLIPFIQPAFQTAPSELYSFPALFSTELHRKGRGAACKTSWKPASSE